MAAEVFVKCVKYRKFQSIDYTTDGVDDAACQKPAKRGMREIRPQLGKYWQARPAHGNVNDGRKPFRTGDPESFDNDSCHCNSPYKSQKGISNSAAQDDHADRGIRSGNQNEDHHVIKLLKIPEYFGRYMTDTVIDCACRVQ